MSHSSVEVFTVIKVNAFFVLRARNAVTARKCDSSYYKNMFSSVLYKDDYFCHCVIVRKYTGFVQ